MSGGRGDTMLEARFSASLVSVVILIGCAGCGSKDETVQKLPAFTPLTNAPALERYVTEFASPTPQGELLIPVQRHLIAGGVISVDHNTNCWLWLIRSHTGSNYYDGQRLYLYSDKSAQFSEVKAFNGLGVREAFVLSDQNGEHPFILASVRPTNALWWVGELLTNNLRSNAVLRMTAGDRCKVAPDHLKVGFWRANSEGFHSFHVWDLSTGCIENVISMWETDPGSGTSWQWEWSADSKALHIQGTCSGFSRSRAGGRKEFDLLYLVDTKQVFSLRHLE